MDPNQIQLNHLNLISSQSFESLISSSPFHFLSERRFTFRSRIDATRSNVPSDFSSRPLSKTVFGRFGGEIPPPSSESFHTRAFNSLLTKNGRYRSTKRPIESCNDAFNYASKMVSTDMIRFLLFLLCRKSWALKRKLRLPASVTSPDAWLARRQLH